jgi:hypothetical protein
MPTPPVVVSTIAGVPRWVREGQMYTMFFKMHTAAGTINAALPDLNRIAAMGYNILWVLPVMKNRDPINNGPGPGYNIVDFTTVAPEYGTNQDMKNFIAQAHTLGMKVILDITPNHTSSSHPFVLDARTFGQASQYWTYYQHGFLGQGNLTQSATSDGFVYYNGFSDALLNYNWADVDARAYMIDVYRYWVRSIGADGYRFDVYWGPHSRSNGGSGGEGEMGVPVRAALKHIRPDIALLGETAGTGVGTEVNFADQGGGIDEAYDWNLMGTVESTSLWTASTVASGTGALGRGWDIFPDRIPIISGSWRTRIRTGSRICMQRAHRMRPQPAPGRCRSRPQSTSQSVSRRCMQDRKSAAVRGSPILTCAGGASSTSPTLPD